MNHCRRRAGGTADIAPGTLLYRPAWTALRRRVPGGTYVVALPEKNSPLRSSLQVIAARLRAKGLPVAVVEIGDLPLSPHGPNDVPSPS